VTSRSARKNTALTPESLCQEAQLLREVAQEMRDSSPAAILSLSSERFLEMTDTGKNAVDSRMAFGEPFCMARTRKKPKLTKKANPSAPPSGASRWLVLSLLGLALVVAAGVRVRLLDFPLERDEGEYAYVGQLILQGIPPYQLAYTMKMPGTGLAYAALMSVFGQTPAGIHLGLLAVHLATLGILFLVARSLLDLSGAATATAAYALMTLSPAYLGLAAHATHFVMLPALLGTWMILRLEKNAHLFDCLAGGCLFGVAFLMKQNGIFFGLFGGLYLVWMSFSKNFSRRQVLARAGLYFAGCLLPLLTVCLWLKIAGVFPQFWFWTVTYAREYATINPLEVARANVKKACTNIFQAAPFLWIGAGCGLACLCRASLALHRRVFLGGFLVFSFMAVCPGLYFREHYFIVLVPAVALLIGLAVSWSGRRLAELSFGLWLRPLPVALAAVACAQSLYAGRAVFFSLSPLEACRVEYDTNPFIVSLDIARHIEQDTRKDQRIVVVGSEPEIYFYAHRHSCTGYIYTYPLMEPHPFARTMQLDMIREIEQNPPEYLVLVMIPYSWLGKANSLSLLGDWTNDYVQKHMQLVGLTQITDAQTTETTWGADAATKSLSTKYFVAVYKRKGPG
jgi:hypothetical protein